MTDAAERRLRLVVPALAMATVALGLRIGAGDRVRAALVYAFPASAAGTGLSGQLLVFDEERGVREAVRRAEVDVTARAEGREARWAGRTNDDGAAEFALPFSGDGPIALEVRSQAAGLARGVADWSRAGDVAGVGGVAGMPGRPPVCVPQAPAWAKFARREGPVLLDVAVVGQRGASGFPASIWVRAREESTGASIAGATIELLSDASLSAGATRANTDGRGWAHFAATPMGYAVALLLEARAPGGKSGRWAGGLLVSPGAAELRVCDRYQPGESPAIDVILPDLPHDVYLAIDDSQGRAWATVLAVPPSHGSMPSVTVAVPPLAPGLYWAVAAADPAGASELAPGTAVRPFFIAATDDEALAFGTDHEACSAPHDARESERAVAVCLAVAGARPVPRWLALDGFAQAHARDRERRARGLAVALGALVIAGLLETALLLRARARARAALRSVLDVPPRSPSRFPVRADGIVIALLVALLGFALLAAFLLRTA